MTEVSAEKIEFDRELQENLDGVWQTIFDTHERVVRIAPFQTNNDPKLSPFSPVSLEAKEIVGNVQRVLAGNNRAVVICEAIEEAVLVELQQLEKNIRKINLSTGQGVEALNMQLTELINYLEDGGVLVVEGLEKLESSTILDEERYAIMGMLRRLEDTARMSEGSLLLGVVSRGEILPLFVTHQISPAFLAAEKIGFKFTTEWGIEFEEKCDKPENFGNSLRFKVEDLQGEGRRSMVEDFIERVKQGESIVVFGPRRGGKSSIGACVERSVQNENPQTKFYSITTENSIVPGTMGILKFSDPLRKDKCETAMKQMPLAQIPQFVVNLLNEEGVTYSGTKIVFKGDESLQWFGAYKKDFLYDFAAFLKYAKELGLPISLFSVETDFTRGNLLNPIKKDPRNMQNVELSAFTVEQIGLFDDDETRELLEDLFVKSTFKFKDDESKEKFIRAAIQMCSGCVAAVNLLVDYLNEYKNIEKALRRMKSYLRGPFKAFLGGMTKNQKKILQVLLYSKGHSVVIQNAQMFEKELTMMQGQGYIEFHYKSEDRQKAYVTLKAIDGFKIAVMARIIELIAIKSDEERDNIMIRKGYSEEQIKRAEELSWQEEQPSEAEEGLCRDYEFAKTEGARIARGMADRGELDISEISTREDHPTEIEE